MGNKVLVNNITRSAVLLVIVTSAGVQRKKTHVKMAPLNTSFRYILQAL